MIERVFRKVSFPTSVFDRSRVGLVIFILVLSAKISLLLARTCYGSFFPWTLIFPQFAQTCFVLLSLSFITRRWFWISLWIIITFYYAIHVGFSDYFSAHLSPSLLYSYSHEMNMMPSTPTMLFYKIPWICFVDFPILFLIAKRISSFRWVPLIAVILWMISIAKMEDRYFNFLHAGIYHAWTEKNVRGLGPADIAPKYGYIIADVVNLLAPQDDIAQKINEQGDLKHSGKRGKKIERVALVQVESLDWNLFDLKACGVPVIPNLNKLRAKAFIQQKMIAYHGAGGSSDADFTALTSKAPSTERLTMKASGIDFQYALPKMFLQHGFRPVAWHNGDSKFYNRAEAYLRMGFESFYDYKNLNLHKIGWGGTDGELFQRMLDSGKVSKNPQFNFAITVTSHPPFQWISDMQQADAFPCMPNNETHLYFSSMHDVDSVLANFVEQWLSESRSSVVLLYGDHSGGYLDSSEYFVPALVREGSITHEFVPFLGFSNADVKCSIDSTRLPTHLDILPTLLDVVGIDAVGKWSGSSLCQKGGNYD